jgi:acetoin utilization deacetylase AcuC-like enzyme
MSSPLAVVDDPSFDEHRPPGPHPERPERLMAARRAAERVTARVGRLEVAARAASDDELGRVHHADYLERLGQKAGTWSSWDEDTYAAPGSPNASRRAAGGAVELVNALLDGRAERGVALLRPPGHHAVPAGAMGFCLLNNVAVAAAHARARGVERVMILDFDVHHGNGTQDAFYTDPSVLFVSLHQFPLYPGSGAHTETGSGDGVGYTVNIPLSAGARDAVYTAAFSRIVAPLAAEYAPGLVLLSAGFDAHRDDPLAQMELTEAGYASMMHELVRAVPSTKVGMLLEGGYDLAALEASLAASLDALMGESQPTQAPTQQAPDARHLVEIERAERLARAHFRFG